MSEEQLMHAVVTHVNPAIAASIVSTLAGLQRNDPLFFDERTGFVGHDLTVEDICVALTTHPSAIPPADCDALSQAIQEIATELAPPESLMQARSRLTSI